MESFIDSIGEPDFAFTVPNTGVNIPTGVVDCCRVLHQPTCEHYVAACLVGIEFVVRRPSVADLPLHERMQVEGDLLASLPALDGAFRGIWASAQARAEAMKGIVVEAEFHVYCLSPAQKAQFDRLQQQALDEALAAASTDPGADVAITRAIEQMEVVFLPDDEQRSFLERDDTIPVGDYAHLVAIVPGEVGHDGQQRYVRQGEWDASEASLGVAVP